jgi:predicted transposase YdaD
METDKQLYRVFGAHPAWIFELSGLPPVGNCTMRSLTVKTLERRSDGVVIPNSGEGPLWVIEFQFGENPQIYTRTVQKMAAVQEEFNMREVQGIIFFGEARCFFQTIKTSKLKKGVKQALEEVFLSWLIQRLPKRTRQEIEAMLIGELPELAETRAGQDLIEMGKVRGLAEGLVKAVTILLAGKRGRLTKSLRGRIQQLSEDQLCQLLAEADAWESLDPLDAWLTKRGR